MKLFREILNFGGYDFLKNSAFFPEVPPGVFSHMVCFDVYFRMGAVRIACGAVFFVQVNEFI